MKWQHSEIGTGNGKLVSPAKASSQSVNHSKTNIDGATTAIWRWLNTHFNLAG